jgi:hypothetical protein
MLGAGVTMLCLATLSFVQSPRNEMGIMIGIFGSFCFLISPLKIFVLTRRLAKDASRLIRDPKVSIVLNDDSCTVSSDTNTRTIEWKTLTKIGDKADFLLLYCGNILVTYFPKQFLTNEQISFIKSKAGQ